MYVMLSFIDYKKCDCFFQKLNDGTDLTAGSPILLLRNTIQASRLSKYKKLNAETELLYSITAWNKFYKGEKLTRFNVGNFNDFPDIYGFDRVKFMETLNLTPELKEFYKLV